MLYYSLHQQSPVVNFKDATILGQAPDKGLYFPTQIPAHEAAFFNNIKMYSNEAIAFKIIEPFVGNTIPKPELEKIIAETINFNIPLKPITANISSLELFHGPTLAFKDIGARFMSRCLRYFLKNDKKKVIVLAATSGDTGGAVANGFYNIEGIEVVVLYPANKVSKVQEAQITTLGKNIHALKVNGNFDDCQQLVKTAFADTELTQMFCLSSANSINVARWLPQQFYYYFAYKQWLQQEPPVVVVPSGNFGNICAGILAKQSGLPIKHFVAACNINNVVTNYLASGIYEPQKAQATLSNAMDVGNPSNFIRILTLFNQNFESLKNSMSSISINDELTAETIKKVYAEHAYLLDPHGAVAYAAAEKYLKSHSLDKAIILATAHPVKFNPTIKEILQIDLLKEMEKKFTENKEYYITEMEADYDSLKFFLKTL